MSYTSGTSADANPGGQPARSLSVADAVAVLVGVVIGAGIFRLPSLVASQSNGTTWFLSFWALGGLISLIGALCYAELATTYPDAGGEYHYLDRAYGGRLAFLFAWARMTVIQTGSIALQAFLIGEYATQVFDLGAYSPAVYAGIVVLVLTALNVLGVRQGKWAQNLLSGGVVLGLLMVASAGFFLASPPEAAGAAAAGAGDASGASGGMDWSKIGLAMVFVLLTYGGWNETSYLSAEVRGERRNVLRVLLIGLGVVTAVYLLINLAFLRGLGLSGMAQSDVVAAELMQRTFMGEAGANFISVVIVLAVLSTVNGTIITGARTNYALGRDFAIFAPLGRWSGRGNTPRVALLVQGAISLALIGLGAAMGQGFETMVGYTTPVFWTFFLLTGASLIVLRYRNPSAPRPFRVPLYPVTPVLFCAVCAYMLWSGLGYARSLPYIGIGAWVGVAVLAAGVPLALFATRRLAPDAQPPPRGFEVVQPGQPAGGAAR